MVLQKPAGTNKLVTKILVMGTRQAENESFRDHNNSRTSPLSVKKSFPVSNADTVKSQIFVRYLISYFRTFEKSAKFNTFIFLSFIEIRRKSINFPE